MRRKELPLCVRDVFFLCVCVCHVCDLTNRGVKKLDSQERVPLRLITRAKRSFSRVSVIR